MPYLALFVDRLTLIISLPWGISGNLLPGKAALNREAGSDKQVTSNLVFLQ